ncbi:MerR family transcriptional regulator [Streptomyces sp. NPDC090499]|uniref:MerR family transcriptional regulator n=1 Tax=Streptomyces sp. NPDC090499 TaxID=3365965 RepID=UPI00380E8AF7
MKISELAHQADATTKAVRYYESLGLITPERTAAADPDGQRTINGTIRPHGKQGFTPRQPDGCADLPGHPGLV